MGGVAISPSLDSYCVADLAVKQRFRYTNLITLYISLQHFNISQRIFPADDCIAHKSCLVDQPGRVRFVKPADGNDITDAIGQISTHSRRPRSVRFVQDDRFALK
jgi:hypothetical protein